MTTDNDSITEEELDAYVDGQLPIARRIIVEEYLARNPAAAARVMADMRNNNALRLQKAEPPVSAPLVAAAGRLERSIAQQRLWRMLPHAAAIVLALGTGWIAGDAWDSLQARRGPAQPFYVEEALMSHNVALVRAQLPSQLETAVYDAREIGAATQIVLPDLPRNWVLRDVQLFPSDRGPSLQVIVDRGNGRLISLFAIRERTRAPIKPDVISDNGDTVAYWQEGDLAYALTGTVPKGELDRIAEDLADNVPG